MQFFKEELEVWEPSEVVTDPAEKGMGAGECGNQYFASAIAKAATGEVRRRDYPNGFRLYRTINPEQWTFLEFVQFNYDPKAVCDAGGIYPAAADRDFLYWASACSTGVGAPGEENCEKQKEVVVADLTRSLTPPISYYWEKGYHATSGQQSEQGLAMTIFSKKPERNSFDKLIPNVLMVNPQQMLQMSQSYTLPKEEEFFVTINSKGEIQYSDTSKEVGSVSSSDGMYTAKRVGRKMIGEDPGYVTWDVQIVDVKGAVIQTLSPSTYGERWRTIEPLAFTQDGKDLLLQIWGARGGDISDSMALVSQSVMGKTNKIIVQNTPSAQSMSTSQAYYQVYALRPLGNGLHFSKTFFQDSQSISTELYLYNLVTKETQTIANSLPGWTSPFWSQNGEYSAYLDGQKTVKLLDRNGTQRALLPLDIQCSSILGLDNRGEFVALTCENDNPVAYIFNLKNGKNWKLFHQPGGVNANSKVTASFMFFR